MSKKIDGYIQFIPALGKSQDKALRSMGHCLKRIFCAGDNSTSQELLTKNDEIDSGVKNYFPSGFARGYESWRREIDEFQISLESGVYENIEAGFKDMLSELKNTWKMLLEFFIFLFMMAVNRMDKEHIKRICKEEFEKAFSLYKIIFHQNMVDKIEENKSKLTIYLMHLFRKLYSHNAIGSEFILRSLLKGVDGFNHLFPSRFYSIFLLFSKLNDGAVKQILIEHDVKTLQNISFLSNWAILDIINTIIPIFKNFYLVYISEIKVDKDGEPYKTTGISISGLGDPKKVHFRLLPGHQSDSTMLQKANLYLIDRKKQIGFHEFHSDSREYLTPEDYMNLTPLMLYTTFQEPPGKKPLDPGMEIPGQKELFVFNGYETSDSEKLLKFLEFSGKRIEQIKKIEKSPYYKLFEDYEAFSKNLTDYYIDIEKIIKKVVLETSINASFNKSASFDFVYKKTWDLSISHISSLVRIDEYDSEAVLKGTLENRNENVKFIEEVFVPPKEEKHLEQFISSGKRGLIVIGKSGMGKSNLLCSFFLKQRRAKRLNIFIDARRLHSKDIKNSLKKSIAERINEDWGIKEFDHYLQNIQENITILIDAVNEFNNVGGAVGLLEEICEFAEDANIFKNIKIIASCRNETWDQYKAKIGYSANILNDEYFFTQSGDAVTLSGFEDGREREMLYSAYQKYYLLKPGSYNALSPAVRDLIKQPFMMGLIADIYSNRRADSPASSQSYKTNKIAKKLDYFLLFKLLTQRKKDDAKRLSDVADIKRESFDEAYEKCLFRFARILYDKIVEPGAPGGSSESEDKSDSLRIDQLDKHKDFNEFLDPISTHNKTTIFTAVIQVGLIERIYVDEQDYWGNKKSGRAYKFFHDQYTQFCLSAAFSGKDILGNLKGLNLKPDTHLLDAIVQKIEHIIEMSQNAPILSGGLHHWLYNNVFDEKRNLNDSLILLFNRMVDKDSNMINYFMGSFLHWLIDTNIISAEKLNDQLVKNGKVPLRKCFHQHIPQIWPDISPHTLQAIITGEKDETSIRQISDIFMDLFTLESGEGVIRFLDQVLVSYERISLKDLKKLFEINKLKRDFIFAQMFINSSLLCNFSDPRKMSIIRDFLKRKYNWVFDVLTNKKAAGIKGKIQGMMYNAIEKSGIYQWNQAVGPRGGNNNFFIEDEGVVQRDVLRSFYKYCAAFHNGEMERFSLETTGEYMTMTLKMMKYRNESIIGYAAILILCGVLKDRPGKLDDIVDEIIKLNSRAALSFSITLVHMLTKTRADFIDHILDIFHKKLLPEMIDHLGKGEDEYAITSFIVIAAEDFDRYWKKSEMIFSDIIDHLNRKGDKRYMETVGDMLVDAFFPPDIRIGVKICDYLLKKKLHQDPLWREFTLKMLAGMLARSPKMLKRILDDHLIKDTMINEVRPFLTEDIIKARSEVSYQHSWNNFFAFGFFGSKKLRYLFIRYIFAGLVQADSVEGFLKIARSLMVEGIRAFLLDDAGNEEDYDRLDLDIQEKET